jgi:ATP-binding cassette subfamily C (CFTR/MRP) protein 1
MKKFLLPVLICMSLWIACKTIASIFIEKSCENPSADNREVYFYVIFMIGSNIFTFIRSYLMVVAAAKQGKYIHDQMVKSLLYASLSKFFNRVPVGRIINRLTKDLREID